MRNGGLGDVYSYDIYSAPTIKNARDTVIGSTAYGKRFLFTGREYLASIGLSDYRNRVYSPELGRFLQPDPYNIHSYCGNDPVNNIDPSGLVEFSIDQSDWSSTNYNSDYLERSNPGAYSRTSASVFEAYYGMGSFFSRTIWDLWRAGTPGAFLIPEEAMRNQVSQTTDGWARSIGLNPDSDAAKAGYFATMVWSTGASFIVPGVLTSEGLGISTKIGQLTRVSESMSANAALYQSRITGLPKGMGYLVNGVKFDGYANGVLLDAKGLGYAKFIRNGQFKPWWNGARSLIEQARRQLIAAKGTPIEWHFAEESAANATKSLFQSNGIDGIKIIFTP